MSYFQFVFVKLFATLYDSYFYTVSRNISCLEAISCLQFGDLPPDICPLRVNCMLSPLPATGRGAELLVADRVKPILSPALERTLNYLMALDENKLNGKVRPDNVSTRNGVSGSREILRFCPICCDHG